MNDMRTMERVGLVGYGAIGSQVGRALSAGDIDGMCLAGVVDPVSAPNEWAIEDVESLLDRCDVVVEAANKEVLSATAQTVLAAERTLLALSVGALLTDELWPLVVRPTSGHLLFSSGAIGGLDLIRAVGLADTNAKVELTSRKKPRALEQPWMTEEEMMRLRHLPEGESLVLYDGDAIGAAKWFPQNLNVAAALAIALRDRTRVRVRLLAVAEAEHTVHEIKVDSHIGSYQFQIGNRPSSANGATSEIVAYSVLRCLQDLSPSSPGRFG